MAMKIPLFSIRTRALLLVVVTFVVTMGILTYVELADRNDNLAKAMESLHAKAEHIANEQNTIVNYAQQLVVVLFQTHELSDLASNPNCQISLAAILKQEPRLANVAIANPKGDYVCSAVNPGHLVNIADRIHFKKALASPDIVTGDAVVGRSSGKWGIPFAKSIRDGSGHLQGVLVVFVDLEWVNHELGKTDQIPGARIGLIDAQGTVLARQPDPDKWVGRNAAQTAFFQRLIAQHGVGTAEAPGFDGVKRIYGFAKFVDTTSGPIYLWLGVSKESVTAAVYRKFAWDLSLMLAFLVLTFGIAWAGTNRMILQPISAIAQAARRLGHGDQNACTGLAYTADELGQLARTFDEMAVALRSENELLRLNRALNLLSRCNMTLVHAHDEQELLTNICRLTVETGGYLMSWVGYAEDDAEKSVRPVAASGYEEGYLESLSVTWADSERGWGPTGSAIRSGVTSVNQNCLTNPKMAPWRAAAIERGYQSSIALPLTGKARVLGALTIYSAEPFAFGPEEVNLLEELATDLAYGIEALRTRVDHEQQATILRQSLEQSIQAMAATLEARDPYTAGHQRRVAELATAIARKMQLSDEQVNGISLAATIHDLGKIHVPSEILSKPGKLSDLELALIKTHPDAGYGIIKDVKFPWPIAEIVRQHHERLDGSGYPQGLKGAHILIESRIIAVADVVEAMASHRPYRPSLGIAAALDEIARGRGHLYDAAVVDICLELFAEQAFSFSSGLGTTDGHLGSDTAILPPA